MSTSHHVVGADHEYAKRTLDPDTVKTLDSYALRPITAALVASTILATPPAAAEGAPQETVEVGNVSVTYDRLVEVDTTQDGRKDRASYYLGGALVLTAYDTNGDGLRDLWFRYDDRFLDLEMSDADGDGKPDKALHIDRNEKITRTENLSAGLFGLDVDIDQARWLGVAALVGFGFLGGALIVLTLFVGHSRRRR